ncbi:MAG: type II toxin-antitoxin system RelE/ParE family toxin [Alkalinema sp. CAN_BIN05]|nr:type II toxin-antitoxin system RelE/ParE family toxin [Alkalinema sp. CAN_BIN05]
MSRYVINVLATRDLNDIGNYFAENSIEAGERFFQAFDRKCKQLVAFPSSGKRYPEVHPDIRGLLLENHILLYKILDDGIEILRIVNGRRDLLSLFEELN